jgi:hypothetical protein
VFYKKKKQKWKQKKKKKKREKQERERERTVFTSLKSANSRSGISFSPILLRLLLL